ncbi:alkyl hydroperoxide reductase, F subunit [Actinobaculum suis]|uniref:Alkyl hydroperoxide reductase, F subunit n=1 Tax=Actinobaculum suis TaxID=1657 RepID=A0A7Z8YA43_9ACTO|nr:alkyl hydroperoxide reductase subunit F [Actinobaculum suis]VDG76783.1 alkyl hydroperoxide reductase, F subunit [Actinobaculum suis]
MAVLDAQTTAQLKKYFELIREPIEFELVADESPESAKLRAFLEETAAISEKITVREVTGERAPAFRISRTGTDVAVTFAGYPGGREFESFLLAVLQVGGHPVKIDEDVAQAVRELPALEFTTYISQTCQNCPVVVQALNAMSVLNPKIRHTAVEGSSHRAEVERLGVLSVPTIYLNGEEFAQGRMGVEKIIAKLAESGKLADASGTTPEGTLRPIAERRMDKADDYDVLVIGGGPAGATAAIYSARKGLKTALATGTIGGQVLETTDIENITGTPHIEGVDFGAAIERHLGDYDIDIYESVEATGLERTDAGKIHVTFAGGGELRGRSAILALGASWRLLGVPGESEYRTKGVSFCAHCDGPMFAGKPLAVVGGGNSGVEAAIDLAGVASHVSLFEFQDHLNADSVLIKKAENTENIDIHVNAAVSEVLGDGEKVTGLAWNDRASGERHEIDLSGVFVQIGLVPATAWLGDTVERNRAGEIIVDKQGATSLEGVYAAGDCTDGPFKQVSTALGSGATAALGAFNHMIREGVEA